MKTIIALTGQKQSGKDTIARAIIQNDPSFVKYAFAEPVREAAKAFFGWDDSVFAGDKEAIDEFWGISPREALQYIGTEVGRQGFASAFPMFHNTTGDQLWVKRFQKFAASLPMSNNIVISDVRFENELNGVREMDPSKYHSIVVGVTRKGAKGDDHASEREVSQCIGQSDYVYINNGTLSDIEEFVEWLFEEVVND